MLWHLAVCDFGKYRKCVLCKQNIISGLQNEMFSNRFQNLFYISKFCEIKFVITRKNVIYWISKNVFLASPP